MTSSSVELDRKMPVWSLINDNQIREATFRITLDVPEYFWTVPASTSEYHNPICRHEHGLWAHTLMTVTAVHRLVDSYQALYNVDSDLAYSAAILHDQRKNGDPEDPADSAISDHDLYMADVIRGHEEAEKLPDAVPQAVAEHMGSWYDGPEPSSPLAELVHNADMMASTANCTLGVPGPVPQELRKIGCTEAQL